MTRTPSIRLRQFQPRFLRDGFGRAGDLFPKLPFRAVLPQGSHTRRVGEVPGGSDQHQLTPGAADDAVSHPSSPSGSGIASRPGARSCGPAPDDHCDRAPFFLPVGGGRQIPGLASRMLARDDIRFGLARDDREDDSAAGVAL